MASMTSLRCVASTTMSGWSRAPGIWAMAGAKARADSSNVAISVFFIFWFLF